MKRVQLRLVSAIAISFIFSNLLFATSIPTFDLTGKGSNAIVAGAFFQQIDSQSTGSGLINPFLTIQKNKTEQGYNTDGSFEKGFDMTRDGFNRSLKLSEAPIVEINNTAYRQFLLDINEPNNKGDERLSLDSLKIYQAGTSNIDSFAAIQKSPLVYDLGAAWIGLADLNSGSGSGDYFVYIPSADFSADTSLNYIYLYSQFGKHSGWESSGGFEEWAVLNNQELVNPDNKVPLQTPEPGSLLLLATGVVGLGFVAIRKLKR
jgi:hypothetical protein